LRFDPAARAGEHHQTLVPKAPIDAFGSGDLVVDLAFEHHLTTGLHLVGRPVPLALVSLE
jgi:hypothetical protein